MRLALSLAVLGALASPAFADGDLARVDTDGFLVFFVAVVVGLVVMVLGARGWKPRLQRSGGLPAARVVDRRRV